jgi:hypothetical protein
MGDPWERLAAPFERAEMRWQLLGYSADGTMAQLRPCLLEAAIRARLDAVVGVSGWSCAFFALGEEAIGCNLTVLGVTRGAMVALEGRNPVACAEEALARAAEQFKLLPPVAPEAVRWVEVEPESKTPLGGPTEVVAVEAKSAGRQAIDRLLERLREQGAGRAAAELVVAYGGYGRSPEASRELYGKLRALLQETYRQP